MRRRGVLAGWCTAAFTIAVLAIAPAVASAKIEIFKLHSKQFDLAGFETIFPKLAVPTPGVSGFITRMDAHLIDDRGRRVSIRNVMLHHIVFITSARDKNGSCPGRGGEPFWGTGEERQPMILPEGYGYQIRAKDRWRMQTMIMSHSLLAHKVRIAYTVRMVVGATLTRVKPLWLRANGCSKNPSYDIEGDLPPGSVHTKSSLWRMPLSGRIVAASGHLHGSSLGMTISQPRCNDRTLFEQDPLYGFSTDLVYRVRPILHEPGPIATGMFLSKTGIPVRKGEMIKVTGRYDGSRPHPRVMAISHIYIAPDRAAPRGCDPLPKDDHIYWTRKDGRSAPPVIQLPINGLVNGQVEPIDHPPGTVDDVSAPDVKVTLGGDRIFPANLSVKRGTKVTWDFTDTSLHNITLASGPRLVVSPSLGKGATHTQVLSTPGTYKLFCYLHPITMTQVVTVRP